MVSKMKESFIKAALAVGWCKKNNVKFLSLFNDFAYTMYSLIN